MISQKARGLHPFAARICWALLLAAGVGSVVPAVAYAQRPCPGNFPGFANDIPNLQCGETIFANLLRAAFLLAGIIAFLFLVVGGFKYLTAGGDEKAVGDAKKAISGAVLGLILVVAAYALLSILSYYILGSTTAIFQFTIPGP